MQALERCSAECRDAPKSCGATACNGWYEANSSHHLAQSQTRLVSGNRHGFWLALTAFILSTTRSFRVKAFRNISIALDLATRSLSRTCGQHLDRRLRALPGLASFVCDTLDTGRHPGLATAPTWRLEQQQQQRRGLLLPSSSPCCLAPAAP